MNDQGPLTIRPRQPEDLPGLSKVLVRVHELDGYPVEGIGDPEAWLTPPREIAAWTALLNNQPIGQVSLTEGNAKDDAARVWIKETGGEYADIAIPVRLFVDPAHRELGAGKQLMLAAYQHAQALGKRLVFDVMLKDQKAIRLYESLGSQQLGTITHYHSNGLEEPAAVYIAPQQMPANHS